VFVFSLFDYVGYNTTCRDPTALRVYRAAQVGLQITITTHLYATEGWQSAAAFNLIWWTWSADWGYYGLAYTFNPSAPWENRTWNGLQNDITWAWWTPAGLVHYGRKPISQDVLTMQALLGISIAALLTGTKPEARDD
jgi:hypothetical protein